MTVAGFNSLLCGCSQLRGLSYSGFEDDGTILLCAAQSCPMLQYVLVDTISLEACLALSQCCQRISRLSVNLWYRTQLTAAHLEALKQSNSLENLDISSCSVTDEGLAVLGEFPSLKSLSLYESNERGPFGQLWTGAGFKVFANSFVNQTIENLTVIPFKSPTFDFAALVDGIASCHQLRELAFGEKCVCSDDFLETIAVGCPLIEKLNIHHGSPLTMEGTLPTITRTQLIPLLVLLTHSLYCQVTDLLFLPSFHCQTGVHNFILDSPRLKTLSFCYNSCEGMASLDDYEEPYWRVTANEAARRAKEDVAALQQRFKHIIFEEGAY